jgi:superfamily II DNA or RNA helicase
MKLPAILEQIEKKGNNIDVVMATSMFGTGVDINRLSLMVVHGQPKTTASYIQATGRVGREMGALVVTFLRSTRPRDLDHYEFFTGYHRSLQRYVEPVTVAPFSPRACDKALGPVAVAILRNGLFINNQPINQEWSLDEPARQKNTRSGSRRMGNNMNAKELKAIVEFLEKKGNSQQPGRRRIDGWVTKTLLAGFQKWENIVRSEKSPLFYYEQTYIYEPEHPVVLGDASHTMYNKAQVYYDTPQSLRELEQSTRFE